MMNQIVPSLVLAALACFSSIAAAQDNTCNPLTSTALCPPAAGINTSNYFIDFTKTTSLPPGWTLANYENVTFGPNGAEFTFAKKGDAPYIWTEMLLFGHVEVVMQAAPGVGIISSAVLISDDLDEIDWEFSGNNFGYPTGKVQTNYFGKGVTGSYDRGTLPDCNSPQTEVHTYTLDWSATQLTWSIDSSVVRTLLAADANDSDHQYPQSPMRLQLGLWNGGDPSNAAGTIQWATGGALEDLSNAPFTMYVKSALIENATPCSSYEYSDKSGSYQSIKCVGAAPNTTTSTSSTPYANSTVTSATIHSSATAATSTISNSSCNSTDTTITGSTAAAAGPGSSTATGTDSQILPFSSILTDDGMDTSTSPPAAAASSSSLPTAPPTPTNTSPTPTEPEDPSLTASTSPDSPFPPMSSSTDATATALPPPTGPNETGSTSILPTSTFRAGAGRVNVGSGLQVLVGAARWILG